MAQLTYQKFPQQLNPNALKPIYFIYGDEPFLVQDCLNRLSDAVVDPDFKDFNLDTFYGGDHKPETICESLDTLPMMSSRRMVVIKEAHALKEKHMMALERYVTDPVPTTLLVFVSSKVDKRKKFFKLVAKSGDMVEVKKPYDNQVRFWVERFFKQHGLNPEPQCVPLIQQLVGNELNDLHNEIIKLSQYMGDNRDLTVDHVLKVVSRTKLESVFELTKAIGNKDQIKSLLCLAKLLDDGQNELAVLALIARHLRLLYSYKQGMALGHRGADLARFMGVAPFFLKEYEAQNTLWTETGLKRATVFLSDMDVKMKRSLIQPHFWLENFIFQTCSASS